MARKRSIAKEFEEAGTYRTPRRPLQAPIYGLWIPDGGQDGMGAWMVDTSYDQSEGDVPMVCYDVEAALSIAREERLNGLPVIVMELAATAVVDVPALPWGPPRDQKAVTP